MAIARASLGNIPHPDAPQVTPRVALQGRYVILRDRDPGRDGVYGMKLMVNTPALNDVAGALYVNELPEWHTKKLQRAAQRRSEVIAALEQQIQQNKLMEELRAQEATRKLEEAAQRKPKPNADTPRKMELRQTVNRASSPQQLSMMLAPDIVQDFSAFEDMNAARLAAYDAIDAM